MLRYSRRCANTPGSTPKPVSRKVDMLVFRDMIAAALVEHNLPFAFVEYKRIRLAFSYLNHDVQTWCRNTAANDCLKLFEREKLNLKKSLSEIPGRMCLTTNLWRALTIEGYMCLTAHYVDTDWSLKAKIIAFCAFRPPHSGMRIAMRLNELLKEWGLEKKVFSLTADNASANDNMQGILKEKLQKDLVSDGEFFHVRCSAHILNLIVQDGVAVIGDSLQKIRDSVKFVKGSENRELIFESCRESLGIQLSSDLILEVTTRWNSTFLILSRAIEYKSVLKKLAEVERSYNCLPSTLEWRLGEMICEFLQPFYEMTKLISGSSYPRANLYFMQVWKIERWLRNHAFSSDEVIVKMVEAMQLKFDKYWEEYSDILAIAVVLDPRLKFTFLEYCFKTLDSSTYKAKLAHVKEKMTALFKAYEVDESSTTSNVETTEEDIPSDYTLSLSLSS